MPYIHDQSVLLPANVRNQFVLSSLPTNLPQQHPSLFQHQDPCVGDHTVSALQVFPFSQAESSSTSLPLAPSSSLPSSRPPCVHAAEFWTPGKSDLTKPPVVFVIGNGAHWQAMIQEPDGWYVRNKKSYKVHNLKNYLEVCCRRGMVLALRREPSKATGDVDWGNCSQGRKRPHHEVENAQAHSTPCPDQQLFPSQFRRTTTMSRRGPTLEQKAPKTPPNNFC